MVKTRLRECDASRGACFPSPSGALTHLSLYLSDGYCSCCSRVLSFPVVRTYFMGSAPQRLIVQRLWRSSAQKMMQLPGGRPICSCCFSLTMAKPFRVSVAIPVSMFCSLTLTQHFYVLDLISFDTFWAFGNIPGSAPPCPSPRPPKRWLRAPRPLNQRRRPPSPSLSASLTALSGASVRL